MPGKRTNDSVEKILQELGQKQNADDIRDRMTDRQVDDILAQAGISVGGSEVVLDPVAPADMPKMEVGSGKPPEDRFSTAVLDDLLGDLPSVKQAAAFTAGARSTPDVPAVPKTKNTTEPVTEGAQKRHTVRAETRHSATDAADRLSHTTTLRPKAAAAPRTGSANATEKTTVKPVAKSATTMGDTTRTGIIKGFLAKMAPEGAEADADALNAGKQQFMKYFGNSVAVVPDQNGRLRDPNRKKKGLFGLASAEDTGEFVPINVSLSGGRGKAQLEEEQPLPADPYTEPQADTAAPEQEYYPDAQEETNLGNLFEGRNERAPKTMPRTAKKKGLFSGLFAGRNVQREEIVIPEGREEPEDALDPGIPQFEGTAQIDIKPDDNTPEQAPENTQTNLDRSVFRSKYSEPQKQPPRAPYTGMTLGGETLGFLRDAINNHTETPSATAEEPTAARDAGGQTVYRKKRNTIEFTPGKKKNEKPAVIAPSSEPVGEPVMTSTDILAQAVEQADTSHGFTMQIGGQTSTENTQDFLAELDGDRRGGNTARARAAEPRRRSAAERPPEPAIDTHTDTSTFDNIPASVAQTLTGQVRLADIQARTATLGINKEDVKRADAAQKGFARENDDSENYEEYLTNDYIEDEPKRGKIDKASFVEDIASSINFEEDATDISAHQKHLRGELPDEIPDDDGRYQDAVARLRGEMAESTQAEDAEDAQDDTQTELKKPAKGFGLHFGGKPADEQEGATEPFEENKTEKNDYETLDDAGAVRAALDKQVLGYGVAAIVTGILGAVMLYFGTAAAGKVLPLPAPLSLAAGKTPLLATMLVMLLVAGGISWRTLLEGANGLIRKPTPDSMPLLAAAGALIQLIVFIAQPELFDPARFCLLAGPAALLLCMNNVGKLLAARTAAENFKMVSAGVDHAVAYRLRDAGVLRTITSGLAEPHPCVIVSRPTQLLKKFVASSASHGTSDKNQQQFAWIVSGCALAGLVFTLLYRKDIGMAVTALAATLCLGAPLAGTLLSALPASLMQRSAARVGAVIPGWKDIRQLGRINVIEVTARDLFPAGCVQLGGIKAVNDDHIYTAIVYAASLLAEAGENMREVFLGMIGDANKQLCKVDDLQQVYGKGCVGWIEGERALIGNRALMADYGIRLPDLAYEQRHTVNQRRVIYLAVSGKLFAMFQVTYATDPDTAAVLDSLRRSGMSLIVDCDDFNVDANLLETAYNMPVGSVKILSGPERDAMAPATAWLPESEGNMMHLGGFASFVGGLEAAAGAAEGERKSAMVVSASVLLSCLLAIIMALAGGLAALPLPALVLYQAAWAVLAMIFPLLQRY